MDKVHPQIRKAIMIIKNCILNFIDQKNGAANFSDIEKHTGLKNYSNDLVARILKEIEKECGNTIIFNDGVIMSKDQIETVKNNNKVELPEQYNKLWTDEDIVGVVESINNGSTVSLIARGYGRTEGSIQMMLASLRKAYRMEPIIKKYKTVQLYVETHKSIVPAE